MSMIFLFKKYFNYECNKKKIILSFEFGFLGEEYIKHFLMEKNNDISMNETSQSLNEGSSLFTGANLQILLLIVLTVTLLFAMYQWVRDSRQNRAENLFKLNDYRNSNENLKKIREYLILDDAFNLRNLDLTEKMDFVNFHELVYSHYKSKLLTKPVVYNFFGQLVIDCFKNDNFWDSKKSKNPISKDDDNVKKFKELYELMLEYNNLIYNDGENVSLRTKIDIWWESRRDLKM